MLVPYPPFPPLSSVPVDFSMKQEEITAQRFALLRIRNHQDGALGWRGDFGNASEDRPLIPGISGSGVPRESYNTLAQNAFIMVLVKIVARKTIRVFVTVLKK